jgi:hypothetical protein
MQEAKIGGESAHKGITSTCKRVAIETKSHGIVTESVQGAAAARSLSSNIPCRPAADGWRDNCRMSPSPVCICPDSWAISFRQKRAVALIPRRGEWESHSAVPSPWPHDKYYNALGASRVGSAPKAPLLIRCRACESWMKATTCFFFRAKRSAVAASSYSRISADLCLTPL